MHGKYTHSARFITTKCCIVVILFLVIIENLINWCSHRLFLFFFSFFFEWMLLQPRIPYWFSPTSQKINTYCLISEASQCTIVTKTGYVKWCKHNVIVEFKNPRAMILRLSCCVECVNRRKNISFKVAPVTANVKRRCYLSKLVLRCAALTRL